MNKLQVITTIFYIYLSIFVCTVTMVVLGDEPKPIIGNSHLPQVPEIPGIPGIPGIPAVQTTGSVTDKCLTCLQHAIIAYNSPYLCPERACGAYRISWAYWADCGKPTVSEPTPTILTSEFPHEEIKDGYEKCVTNIQCASACVRKYMNKFHQDCNQDSFIDCYDYAGIHIHGGYGCQSNQLPSKYHIGLDQCLKS